jgi:hypothetical protein
MPPAVRPDETDLRQRLDTLSEGRDASFRAAVAELRIALPLATTPDEAAMTVRLFQQRLAELDQERQAEAATLRDRIAGVRSQLLTQFAAGDPEQAEQARVRLAELEEQLHNALSQQDKVTDLVQELTQRTGTTVDLERLERIVAAGLRALRPGDGDESGAGSVDGAHAGDTDPDVGEGSPATTANADSGRRQNPGELADLFSSLHIPDSEPGQVGTGGGDLAATDAGARKETSRQPSPPGRPGSRTAELGAEVQDTPVPTDVPEAGGVYTDLPSISAILMAPDSVRGGPWMAPQTGPRATFAKRSGLAQPGYASGDQFAIAAALKADPGLKVYITYPPGQAGPASKIAGFYAESGLGGQFELVEGGKAEVEKRYLEWGGKVSRKEPLLGVGDATKRVARNFDDKLRLGLREAWKLDPRRDRALSGWLRSRGFPLRAPGKELRVAVLWSRFSGKKGEVHIEHDTSRIGLAQIIAGLGDLDAIVIVGDRRGSRDRKTDKYAAIAEYYNQGTIGGQQVGRPEGFGAKVVDLTEFWTDRTVASWGGGSRTGQFRLYDYLHRNFTTRHLGFRSGNLEAMALLALDGRQGRAAHRADLLGRSGPRLRAHHRLGAPDPFRRPPEEPPPGGPGGRAEARRMASGRGHEAEEADGGPAPGRHRTCATSQGLHIRRPRQPPWLPAPRRSGSRHPGGAGRCRKEAERGPCRGGPGTAGGAGALAHGPGRGAEASQDSPGTAGQGGPRRRGGGPGRGGRGRERHEAAQGGRGQTERCDRR